MKFCSVYKYPIIQTHSALKILSQTEYIDYDENAESLSRIIFSVKRDELYKLKEFDRKTTLVINSLLRNYTGLFADYIFIREELLMLKTNLSREEIFETLKLLSRQRIIHYIPGKKIPTITYLQPREDPDLVVISKNVYDLKKKRFEDRINNIIQYASEREYCRTKMLLRYFGQKSKSDCGKCDICRNKKEKLTNSVFQQIERLVKDILQNGPVSQNDIILKIDYDPSFIIEVIRILLEEDFIYEEDFRFHLKKNK